MNNKKYEVTNNTKVVNGKTLYQIIALKSFNDVKAGDLGGYIESKDNLSQYFKCWVYRDAVVCDNAVVRDNAKVCENAVVRDNAFVCQNAVVCDNAVVDGSSRVFGEAVASKKVYNVILYKHNITLTDNHIAIGCENHTIKYWIKNIEKIGKKNNYNEEEVRAIKHILKGLLILRRSV